jgi:hypothetical protein
MKTTSKPPDRKVILSTLWVFAMFNYIYADIMTIWFNPVLQKNAAQELLSGHIGSLQITQGFVLAAAVLMETAIAMVLLSRVLPYQVNRWANIIVGIVNTASVALSLFGGTPPNSFNLFFSTIEVACTLFIIWYAWTWPRSTGEVPSRAAVGLAADAQPREQQEALS